MTGWWTAGALAALGYGIFLVVVAVQSPSGAELTGRFPGQPAAKAAMAVLLAVAAWCHPIRRERRWLVPALLLSAAGDFFLAMPWWKPSFVLGLALSLSAECSFAEGFPDDARSPSQHARNR